MIEREKHEKICIEILVFVKNGQILLSNYGFCKIKKYLNKVFRQSIYKISARLHCS